MATRTHRSVASESTSGYRLMLPPDKQRYVWSPVWTRDPGGEPVGFPTALEGVECEDCREDMVVSHVEILGHWTELARELLEETARRPDPRRDEMARVLMFFAADLGHALDPGGIVAELGEDSVLMAMAAITEATVVASLCLSQSFSKQLAATVERSQAG